MLNNAWIACGVAAALCTGSVVAQVKVDERLPAYQKTSGVSGSIKSVGSDTMNNLMAEWAEGFHELYPNVQIEIEGKGSATAPPALTQGTATFGPMSRELKAEEIDKFEKAYGYKPTQVPTAIDMLAVYVNKDNPIAKQGLTLQQLDAIFSKARKGGAAKDVRTWGDLGLTGEWSNRPISLYGRNAASGTYGFFREHALFGGDYKDSVKEQPGSSSVVQGVASDKGGIGYSGMGYETADVRTVPLAPNADQEPVPAEASRAGDYPMSRYLYITVNRKPNTELEPLRREFLTFVFSRPGQEDVVKKQYLPLPFKVAQQSAKRVGIDLQPGAADAGYRGDSGGH